ADRREAAGVKLLPLSRSPWPTPCNLLRCSLFKIFNDQIVGHFLPRLDLLVRRIIPSKYTPKDALVPAKIGASTRSPGLGCAGSVLGTLIAIDAKHKKSNS